MKPVLLIAIGLFIVSEGRTQGTLPAGGQTTHINDFEMYYEVHGEGEPLVLLHGFSSTCQMWKPFLDEFAKHYRVIVPDLRGHGRSTNPSNQFTHRQAALDVYALLDHLGIRRFKAMGTSTGGMTLIHMATQQPGRPEALVLVAATIYFPESAREAMRKSTVASLTPQQWERSRQIHKHGDEQIRALREQFHAFKDSYDDMNFTGPYLSTIMARTLIMHGDRDRLFPIEIPVEMYKSIPNAYLWVVPNTGHGVIGNRVKEFTETALAFLRGEWEKR